MISVIIDHLGSSDLEFLGTFSNKNIACKQIQEHIKNEFEEDVDVFNSESFFDWMKSCNIMIQMIEHEIDKPINWFN